MRRIKISDYIVEFLIKHEISDVFGYPGGMVTHLMDSLGKYSDSINTHINYHEQASAFAACGFAQASGKTGVAFATSGPGATNLITGICNAYFDSIPTVFITGQVNTFESKTGMKIRQRGFQETSIVPMVKECTKRAYYVDDANNIPNILDEAFRVANSGRKGPVLLDVPMNIFKSFINVECELNPNRDLGENNNNQESVEQFRLEMLNSLSQSARPCIILGNGISIANQVARIRKIINDNRIPVVSSMLAVDVMPRTCNSDDLYYGFIGAYGDRTANFIVAKSDLIICLGTRMDVRQVGAKREQFAPNAKIIRVDIDENELENKVHEDEIGFSIDINEAISVLGNVLNRDLNYSSWINTCNKIRKELKYRDEKDVNKIIRYVSQKIEDNCSIVTDVGQHMVWVAQSFEFKDRQRLFMSGGMGSMGYALPAAIGIYYATRRPVICFVGDGGLQMNIQELHFIAKECLPIKIFVMNNEALGMIRHFQEMYFEGNYYYTTNNKGYSCPDFCAVAKAYGMSARAIAGEEKIKNINVDFDVPELIEIMMKYDTYVFPKLEFGKPNQDQEPLLDRELYNELMEL